MQIEVATLRDIEEMISLDINYYNNYEGSCWTETTARRRIQQVLNMEDSYSLIMRNADGEVCGFAMGYFKQYDDILGYTLEEILISHKCQNQGWGSFLLAELETRVKAAGASCVELQAVKDEMHERYYGKAGYGDAKNFVMKVKWFA